MVTFLLCTGYNGQMIYSVQFFQLIFASSAWKAGLHLIPIVITNVIAAIASGVDYQKARFS
ncbi:AGA_1a_G0036180.mRNA.1.CDS.1 [Saccharomyces cerevisiae]|nr:AGA_1a_G0036180.mRNA.1.CDS.1 [Saccharomyces cerevisiae]CAI6801310.1 AGA_1a_G0036180.mRNA.1.CDS.1 [Saccharomyces cerevisiae]